MGGMAPSFIFELLAQKIGLLRYAAVCVVFPLLTKLYLSVASQRTGPIAQNHTMAMHIIYSLAPSVWGQFLHTLSNGCLYKKKRCLKKKTFERKYVIFLDSRKPFRLGNKFIFIWISQRNIYPLFFEKKKLVYKIYCQKILCSLLK